MSTKSSSAPKSDKSSKGRPDGGGRIAENRRALYNYAMELKNEFLPQAVKNGELFIIGCQITPLGTASTHVNPDSVRTKKLLMHKDEIRRLIGKTEQKGFTLVPLNLHWKAGRIKCEVALAKGKAEHDKRDSIKEREGKREVERAMKSRQR